MKSKALKNVLNVNGVGIIGMYLVVFIGLSIACPNFLKFSNIMIGIRQAVYTAIVAFGNDLCHLCWEESTCPSAPR
ncbi:MAG: hypothetical protein ACLTW9_21140 [Enterocloster sp.]